MAQEAVAYKRILRSTRAIMFMGVPHDGADAAKLASRIGDVARVFCNLNLIDLKDLKRDSRPLQDISQSFGFLEGFDIITVMESEKTVIPGTKKSILVSTPGSTLGLSCWPLSDSWKVVPATSAQLNLGNRERWFNIPGADHHGVCKFATAAEAGYIMVSSNLERVAEQAGM